MQYDAFLLVSFGGPERSEDVVPFLQNVLRGREVPPERLVQFAEPYELFGGESPLNAQNRALIASVVEEFTSASLPLPVYWGNRNWHPMLADTIREMAEDGVNRALAFVTSPFASYSGCRQYIENIESARQEVGPSAPKVDKLRLFYNHPGFVEPMAERVSKALEQVPADRRQGARILYSVHSLPVSMAQKCEYEAQAKETARLISGVLGQRNWQLVYQSRSGRPSEEWLTPDLGDYLVETKKKENIEDVVIVPIGFISENMEIVYDLDIQIRDLCEVLGVNMVRSQVVGCHKRFVKMIHELVEERFDSLVPRLALGDRGPSPDQCPADCCPRG